MADLESKRVEKYLEKKRKDNTYSTFDLALENYENGNLKAKLEENGFENVKIKLVFLIADKHLEITASKPIWPTNICQNIKLKISEKNYSFGNSLTEPDELKVFELPDIKDAERYMSDTINDGTKKIENFVKNNPNITIILNKLPHDSFKKNSYDFYNDLRNNIQKENNKADINLFANDYYDCLNYLIIDKGIRKPTNVKIDSHYPLHLIADTGDIYLDKIPKDNLFFTEKILEIEAYVNDDLRDEVEQRLNSMLNR